MHSDKTTLIRVYRELRAHAKSTIVAAEILFVAGWSLMWGSSLQLIPFASNTLWLVLMGLGLVCLGVSNRRKHTGQCQAGLHDAPTRNAKVHPYSIRLSGLTPPKKGP